MIDFSEVGYVEEHHVNGEDCVKFFPNANSTVKDMLDILDEGLAHAYDDSSLVRERGILLQTQKSADKGYPIPCVILFEKKERNKWE